VASDSEQIGLLAEEAVKLANAVDRLNEDMSEQVVALSNVIKRDRRRLIVLAVSVVLDIVLSIAVAFFAFTATSAKSTAEQNRHDARVTCQATNEARVQQIQLWDFVLNLSASGMQTPAEKARAQQFRAYVARVFAPRDCGQL
jgi:hypothetical protein